MISKEEAGAWAIRTYDPEWHGIVWEALACRRGDPSLAAFPDASSSLSRAAELVLEVVRQAVDEPPPSMGSVDLGAPRVTEAVVVWSGRGTAAWPQQSRALLVERFGEEAAKELLRVVEYLNDEYHRTDAANVVPGLQEMGRRASSDFRARHPEVAAEAVESLEWCYLFKHR